MDRSPYFGWRMALEFDSKDRSACGDGPLYIGGRGHQGRKQMRSAMPTKTTEATRNVASFRNDDERWEAVCRRDRAADGALLLFGAHDRRLLPAVLRRRACRGARTSSSMPRPPRPKRAGFRPCKRCKPTARGLAERHAAVVANACRLIEEAEELPSLDDLAEAAGHEPRSTSTASSRPSPASRPRPMPMRIAAAACATS